MNLIKLTMSATVIAAAMTSVGASVPADDATSSSFPPVRDIDGDGVIRVACVGDSITAGTPNCNYPALLQKCLDVLSKSDGRKYVVTNHGKGGAACRHVRENVDVNDDGVKNDYFYYDDKAYLSSLSYTPDVVIVQMGTNDALFDNWSNWLRYFDADYQTYLVKPYADKGSLVVLSTPPYACNGWHDKNVNGPVHDREVALARKLGLPIVDTNRLMFGMDEMLADGLHGNHAGYMRMAQNFYRLVFGGKLVTVNFAAKPATRITLRGRDGETFCRAAGENGVADFTFLPGDERLFDWTAECTGFKKSYGTVCISTGTTVRVEQRPGDFNLARQGRPVQCSAKVYGNRLDCKTLNDGNRLKDGYQPERWKSGDWCGVVLDRECAIHSVALYWETEKFVATYKKGGYELLLRINGEWKPAARGSFAVARRPYSGDVIEDTAKFSAPVRISGVRVRFLDGGCSHMYAPKLYEMELLTDDAP